MIAKIKQILLQQYIGAIVTAFIAAQGIQAVISILFSPLSFFLSRVILRTQPNTYEGAGGMASLAWTSLVPLFVSAVLYLVAASLLIWWLFWDNDVPQVETAQNSADPEQADETEG